VPGTGERSTLPRGRLGSPSRAGLLVAALSALLQVGPVLGQGYVLTHDMVFVPRLPLTGALLGLRGVPRAVPSDALVALASRVLPADGVQDLVLVGVLVLGGWGAARLVPTTSGWAGAAAAAAYSWNPYVSGRLLLGQWALLIGYAALPWAASAAVRLRAGLSIRRAAGLVAPLAAAACGGASAGLLAALVALPVVAWPGGVDRARCTLVTAAATAVLALPWALPGVLAVDPPRADAGAFALFAARADTPLGTVGSLLTLGGSWDRDVALPGRDALLPAIAAVALGIVAAAGLLGGGSRGGGLRRRWPQGAGGGLAAAAGLGLMLAACTSLPGLRQPLADAVSSVPGGGLLRDAQKWVAPVALLQAVGLGLAAEAVAAGLRPLAVPRRQSVTLRQLVASLLVVAPAALLPAAALGAGGRLSAVPWPADWPVLQRAAGGNGPVLVLPWSSYRTFPWNGGRALLDPAPRWLTGRTVTDDALRVTGAASAATMQEDPVTRRVDPAIRAGGPLAGTLRREGIPLVMVERTAPGGADQAGRTTGLHLVVQTRELTLLAVPGARSAIPTDVAVGPVVLGTAAAGALAVASWSACAGWACQGCRRRRGHPARRPDTADTAHPPLR